MKCPFCKKGATRVLESRESDSGLRRRRVCQRCERRFTTYERTETTNLLVVKRSGTREGFSREKLRSGVLHSFEKRPVSSERIEAMLDRVEDKVKQLKKSEIPSKRIGEIVMKELKRTDKVAYIRFASVYLDFKDPEDFKAALSEVGKRR